MIAKLLIVTAVMLQLSFIVDGYYNNLGIHLSRAKPLSTAGYTNRMGSQICQGYPFIPRLEPGMRPSKQENLEQPVISTFSLDWLRDSNVPFKGSPLIDLLNVKTILREAVHEAYRTFRTFAQACMKKMATCALILASGFSSFMPSMPPLSIGYPTHLGTVGTFGVAASSVVAAVGGGAGVASASALKAYKDLSATQKLATTPLYYVCNSRGNSYLQEDVQAGCPEQKIVTYFMSSEDANAYLNEMSQVNSYNSNEFRIMSVSFEKVITQIQSRKQSRKLGRYDIDMVYRIQPSSRQVENSERLLGKGNAEQGVKNSKDIAIPMFTAKGLGIKRASGEVVTPYYFAYEDLKEDWDTMMVSGDGAVPIGVKGPKVLVKDFTEVMVASAGMTSSDLKAYEVDGTLPVKIAESRVSVTEATVGIVPPRREIEMIKRYYRNQEGRKNEFQKAKVMG